MLVPDIDNVRTVYTPLTVAGWGRIGYEDEQSDTLKSGLLWIESHYSCKKKFEQYFEIDPHVHICAYAPGESHTLSYLDTILSRKFYSLGSGFPLKALVQLTENQYQNPPPIKKI